jgi:MinD-like ATPase involved in chromosome partitioning or flagellar assembly
LVTTLKLSGIEVVGVYMSEDGSDAKRRLLECGISDVIETDAGPEEFLAKVASTLAHRLHPTDSEPQSTSPALRIGVTGPCEGVGMTEIAIGLAHALASDLDAVLVDLDPHWPSVAQRLDLPLHPNIRTAIDHALHRVDRLAESIHHIGDLRVVGGRADSGQGPEISRPDSIMLMDALGSLTDVVVVDLGPIRQTVPGLVRELDAVIVVGAGTPVGVARLIQTAEAVLGANPSRSVLAVVNNVDRGGFQRSEIVNEIGRAIPDLAVFTIPYDERLEQAAWNGTLPAKGRYRRALESISQVVVGSLV